MAWNANEPGNPAWLVTQASKNGGAEEFCKKLFLEGYKKGRQSRFPAFALGALAGGAIGGVVCYFLLKLTNKQETFEETADPESENTSSDSSEILDETKSCFYDDCMNELRRELSSYRFMHKNSCYLTGVKLYIDDELCEIDAVVFTPECIYILENNRSTKDSFLCNQEYDNSEYNIGKKMELSERLLRKILTKQDRKLIIRKVVLFRSPYLDKNYECDGIKVIPFNCLTDYLNEIGIIRRYSSYDVHEMYELVRMNNQRKVV